MNFTFPDQLIPRYEGNYEEDVPYYIDVCKKPHIRIKRPRFPRNDEYPLEISLVVGDSDLLISALLTDKKASYSPGSPEYQELDRRVRESITIFLTNWNEEFHALSEVTHEIDHHERTQTSITKHGRSVDVYISKSGKAEIYVFNVEKSPGILLTHTEVSP